MQLESFSDAEVDLGSPVIKCGLCSESAEILKHRGTEYSEAESI